MSIKSNRTLQTISLTDYCRNKILRKSTTFFIREGIGYFLHGGVEFTVKAFHELYPVPEKIYYRENSDHTKDFLNLP